jgi:phosphatidylglycerophosphate synthase
VAFVAVESTVVRTVLLGVASLTDLLDGWLARRGASTRLGALLDPVADKTFVLAAISAFLLDGGLSTRDYFIVISRDLAIAVGFLVAYLTPGLEPWNFKARLPGKIVTVLQLLALLALLLRPTMFPALVPLIAIASVWAIADYTLLLHRTRVRS